MKSRWTRWALCLSLLAGMLPVGLARAAPNTCAVSYSPSSVAPGRVSTFAFDIHNGSQLTIIGVQITRPPGQAVTLQAGSATGYNVDVQEDTVTYDGKTMAPGADRVFRVEAMTTATEGAAGDWSVVIFDNNEGSITCSGDLSLMIAQQPSDIVVSNMNVINVGQTGATVTWNTNVPANSQVVYGKNSNYGSASAVVPALTMTHAVSITGLSANTLYHVAATSSDGTGGDAASSGDSTFLTLSVPAAVQAGVASVTGVKAVPTETVPPTVVLATSVAKPFTTAPVLNGTAKDNAGVARIDYSLDGGKSWIVVGSPVGLGTASASYQIVPGVLEDGDYGLVVRATDTSGNMATTPQVTLVVDRMPPRLSSAMLRYGTQDAQADADGRWQTVAGVDSNVTAGAVGGATTMVVVARRLGDTSTATQSFALRHDRATGLWSGVMSFQRAGTYVLMATLRDGGGNQTVQTLPEMVVAPAASVVASGGKVVTGAEVTLYVRHPPATDWQKWDGSSYAQSNPMKSRVGGSFAWLVPAGTYYVEVRAPGFRRLVTHEIAFKQPTALAPALTLQPEIRLGVGKWSLVLPAVTLAPVARNLATVGAVGAGANLIGQRFPSFSLPTTSGARQSQVGLQGKPTVVTLMSTWSPAAGDQLPALAKLAVRNPGFNVAPLYLGEHVGLVSTTLKQAGYTLSAVVDTQDVLAAQLHSSVVPTHYIIGRTGRVVAVLYGVVSDGELAERLKGL